MTAPSLVLLLSIVMAVTYVAIAFVSWFRVRPTSRAAAPENDEPSAIEVEATCGVMRAIPKTPAVQSESPSRWSDLAAGKPASKAEIAVAPHDLRTTAILRGEHHDVMNDRHRSLETRQH
jgi:hypothetical protein